MSELVDALLYLPELYVCTVLRGNHMILIQQGRLIPWLLEGAKGGREIKRFMYIHLYIFNTYMFYKSAIDWNNCHAVSVDLHGLHLHPRVRHGIILLNTWHILIILKKKIQMLIKVFVSEIRWFQMWFFSLKLFWPFFI